MEPQKIKIIDPDLDICTQGIITGKEYETVIQNRRAGESKICYIKHPLQPKGSGKLLAIMPHEYETIESLK